MYESITGTLKEKDLLRAIVEAGGIAYRLFIPLSTYTRLPFGEAKVHLYLTHVVREDTESLYAFDVKEDRNLFEMLLNVSGIGPKTALAIVGHMENGAFQRAIHTSDVRLLSKLPGIGKKTAERLVIEMRDKFKGPVKKEGLQPASFGGSSSLESDAISALIHLGYNPLEAQKAIAAIKPEKEDEMDLGRLITAALHKI